MKPLSSRSWRTPAIVGAALVLAGCAGTTYGTGTSPGAQTIQDIVGIVDISPGGEKEPIDYKPRPTIVAPPTTAVLPPPAEPGANTAANWPRDPDELAAQRQAAAAAAADSADTPTAEILADPGFRLPKKEQSKENRYRSEDPTKEAMMTQQQRQQAKTLFAAAKAGAAGQVGEDGNPVRTTLTEPPAEYRIPDAEAPDEYTAEDDKKKRDWWPFW